MSDDMDQETRGAPDRARADHRAEPAASGREPTSRPGATRHQVRRGANDDDTLSPPSPAMRGPKPSYPTGPTPRPARCRRCSRVGHEPTGADADPWSALPAPSWREEHADWARRRSASTLPSSRANSRWSTPMEPTRSGEPWSFELTSPTPTSRRGPPAASEPTTSSANYEDDWLVVTGERPAVRPIDDFDDDETLISSVRPSRPRGAQSTVEPDVATSTRWPPRRGRSVSPKKRAARSRAQRLRRHRGGPVVDPGDEALHATG